MQSSVVCKDNIYKSVENMDTVNVKNERDVNSELTPSDYVIRVWAPPDLIGK